ncbi:MAG TPA: hypothetical protein VHZ33_12620 [Trebonia sp.]|nr:hypothetical protein [Trebonia sp.]
MIVACRAPADITTGSGRYSSRPPAATSSVTRSTDSRPSGPGSAIEAADVRTRRNAPGPTAIRKASSSPPIGPAAPPTT